MEIDAKRFYRFLAPRNTVLVTTLDRTHRLNVTPVSFIMPVSMDPPKIAMSLSKKIEALEDIRETREFVINIPTEELLGKFWACSKPGEDFNKLKKAGFTEIPSAKVSPHSIPECVAWFECTKDFEKVMGDHVIIVGDVEYAGVRDGMLGKDGNLDLSKAKILMHIGGTKFAVADRELIASEEPAGEKKKDENATPQ